MADERLHFGPCSEKQRLVLQDNETDLLITGGGAGSGKSRTCLTKALAFINDPAARVLIVRLSYPMLKLPGGLVDESKKIYSHFGGIFKVQTLTWEFPNGATVTFKAKPDDITEWQGLQATHILVDEIAEFSEEDILFMQGRIRGADYKGHMGLIGTCNPSRDSFLYKWVEYSLDPSTGVPMPGTEHRRRFFINKDNKIIWADSREELVDIVREKYGEEAAKKCKPLSFRYIPMTIYDNPILMKNNPGYLANLEGQSRVNQLRYIKGSWSARAEGSGFFRRNWIQFVDQPPVNPVGRVRSWDLAASVPSETNRDPDWTVGVLMSRDKYGVYYIEDVVRFRKLTDGVLQEIVKAAHSDGDATKVTIPRDTGAGGKTANAFFLRHLAEHGIAARSVVMSGHSGKLQRFLPFCTLAESGAVRVVKGGWNEEFLAELECFENIRNQKDDIVDSTSDAFNTLAREISLPTMSMPDLSGNSSIPVVR
jgi:predicted phage terminase large subunit-like protein